MKEKFLYIALIFLAFTSCGNGPAKSGETQPVPVCVLTVDQATATLPKTYIGTAEPAKSAYLKCRYPGKLISINVSKGAKVKAGDVLAEVESANVISSHEMAHSTLRQAQDGYDRSVKLYEKGSLSELKMVEVETQLAKAKAAANAADKAMEDCKLKAPYDGIVDDIYVDAGLETDITTNMMRIVDASSIEIRFPVPENEIGRLATGMKAAVTIPALNKENVVAEIVTKGVTASPLSHTYECVLKMEEKVEGLMPGMVTKVRIDDEKASGVLIPATVVRTDAQGRYVWCVENDGVIKKYVVPTGFSGKSVVISAGLEPGDRVITEGVQKVSTGMKVRIVE